MGGIGEVSVEIPFRFWHMYTLKARITGQWACIHAHQSALSRHAVSVAHRAVDSVRAEAVIAVPQGRSRA